jgi:hypothetical protein
VDEIRYEKDPSGGNRLTLVKKIHPDSDLLFKKSGD